MHGVTMKFVIRYYRHCNAYNAYAEVLFYLELVIDDKYLAGNFLACDELLIHILSWYIAVCMTGMLSTTPSFPLPL
jgi:hypothetical protein